MSANDDLKLAAMKAELLAELAHDPKPTPWWVGTVALLAVNVGFCAAVLVLMADAQNTVARSSVMALLVLVVIGGTVFGLRPGSRVARLVMLGASAVAVAAALMTGAGEPMQGPFWAGTSCAMTEGLVSVVPLVTSLLVLSRFAFDPLRTAVVGMSAAAVGVLTLHLHCANGSWAHLAMFHGMPWLVLIAVLLMVRRAMPSKTFAP